jgi:hypothetical protein
MVAVLTVYPDLCVVALTAFPKADFISEIIFQWRLVIARQLQLRDSAGFSPGFLPSELKNIPLLGLIIHRAAK